MLPEVVPQIHEQTSRTFTTKAYNDKQRICVKDFPPAPAIYRYKFSTTCFSVHTIGKGIKYERWRKKTENRNSELFYLQSILILLIGGSFTVKCPFQLQSESILIYVSYCYNDSGMFVPTNTIVRFC